MYDANIQKAGAGEPWVQGQAGRYSEILYGVCVCVWVAVKQKSQIKQLTVEISRPCKVSQWRRCVLFLLVAVMSGGTTWVHYHFPLTDIIISVVMDTAGILLLFILILFLNSLIAMYVCMYVYGCMPRSICRDQRTICKSVCPPCGFCGTNLDWQTW